MNGGRDQRLPALRRFAMAITALNVIGHTFLGFEQSWAHPLIALATGYTMEILLEGVDALINRRRPRFANGGFVNFVNFLLSAHITSLAVAMLLYANDRLFPVAFAVAAAIGSKAIFRVTTGKGTRHFLNPSNFGIATTLLLFPWVGIAPPYMFTENLSGAGDWVLPGIIVVSGTFLNARFTKRIPLILGWVGGFILQGLIRSAVFGTPVVASMMLMTGVAFVLFTFYMVSDPATTPNSTRGQLIFGGSVAVAYGFLMLAHVVFGLFFALVIVCVLRGAQMQVAAWMRGRPETAAAPERLAGDVAVPAESVAAYRRGGMGSSQ